MKVRVMTGIVVCAAIAYIAVVLQAGIEEPEGPDFTMTSASASIELKAALGNIVEIHEKQLAFVTRKYTAQAVGYMDVIDSEIELSKAKIRLAQNRGEIDKVISELRNVIALREKPLRQIEREFRSNQASSEELNEAKIDLLEAKVALYTAIIDQH